MAKFEENGTGNDMKSTVRNVTSSKDDSIHLVQGNGFPWSMTKQEMLKFFVGVNILNGIHGIHFIIDNRKNKCNKTYIQLASEEDYKKILCFNNKKLDGLNIESMRFS